MNTFLGWSESDSANLRHRISPSMPLGIDNHSSDTGLATSTSPWLAVYCVGRRKQSNKNRSTIPLVVARTPAGDDLWEATKHLGTITDAYIPRKRRFNKEYFGFIRFRDVRDVGLMERRLNGISIRCLKLRANLSQVPRPDSSGSKRTSSAHLKQGIRSEIVGTTSTVNYGKSFRDVVSGGPSVHTTLIETPVPKWKSIFIPEDRATYPSSFYGRSLLGEAVDGVMLSSVKFLWNEGDVSDFDVVYVGGLHVLLVFNRKARADDFLINMECWWRKYFLSLVLWTGQAFPRIRIVGLKILGVPLHLRDDITYNAIAGTVHVLSNSWKTIDEFVVITWKGSSYTVMVKEDKEVWYPSFTEEEKISTPLKSPELSPEFEEEDEWEDGGAQPIESMDHFEYGMAEGPVGLVGLFNSDPGPAIPDLNARVSSSTSSFQEGNIFLPLMNKASNKSRKNSQAPMGRVQRGGGKYIFWNSIAKDAQFMVAINLLIFLLPRPDERLLVPIPLRSRQNP
ncbi:hypothetical protein SSX86_004851 [Deinandra increscens subsp. villosa]|uniref:RRM domain-containing protein n=1 Tax=Deinandra increscens subsp. villosa TaxID=3103831 RepID=A0AAP0DPT2_9ASTR